MEGKPAKFVIKVREWLSSNEIAFDNNLWDNPKFERAIRRVLHLSSSYFGFSQRLIRFNAVENLRKAWEECEKIEGVKPDVKEIEELIKSFSIEKIKTPNDDYWKRLSKWARFIRPGWYADARKYLDNDNKNKLYEPSVGEWEIWKDIEEKEDLTEEEKKEKDKYNKFRIYSQYMTLENKLKRAIWATPLLVINPFYDIIKNSFPFLDLINRMTYLNALWKLNESGTHEIEFECALGLKHKIIKMKKLGYLVCGAFWLKDDLLNGEENTRLELKVETKVKHILETLTKFADYFDKTDNSHKNQHFPCFPIKKKIISKNEKLFLLTMAAKFSILKRDLFNEKAKKLKDINIVTISFFKDFFSYNPENKTVNAELLCFAAEWLIFCTEKLLCHYITQPHIIEPNSTDSSDNMATMVFNNLPYSTRITMKITTVKSPDLWKNIEEITLDFKSPQPEKDEAKEQLKGQTLSDYFEEFKIRRKNAYSSVEKFFFSKIRDKLQSLPQHELFKKRVRYFVKGAMVLSLADYGTYFKYDPINDSLEPEYIDRSFLLKNKDYFQEISDVFDALNCLKKEVKEWGENLEKRQKSSSYKCLDGICVVSRFNSDTKDDCMFAKKEKDIESLTPCKNKENQIDWFCGENDIIAIPVLLRGNIQGVLHLATCDKKQFTYENKTSLIDYVQQFEEEIYEAKTAIFEKGIYNLLMDAISQKSGEQRFLYKLFEQVAHLLTVNGVIWFEKRNSFEKKGVIGKLDFEDKTELFIKKINVNDYLDKVIELSSDLLKSKLNINSENSKGWIMLKKIEIPQKKQIFILLYKKHNFHPSSPYLEEIGLIFNLIEQVITHYSQHIEELKSTKNLIGHDIANSLHSIEQREKRLFNEVGKLYNHRYSPYYIEEKYKKIKLIHRDLEKHINFSRILMDVFRGEKVKIDNHTNFIYKVLSPSLGIFKVKYIYVFDKTKQYFIAKAVDLKGKNVNFDYERVKDFPKLWLVEEAIERVLNNLADNVEKYATENSKIEFFWDKSIYFYNLHIKNKAKRLKEQFEENPDRIFEMGIRGVEQEKQKGLNQKEQKGNGLGLFTAKQICGTWGGDLSLNYTPIDEKYAYYDFVIKFPKFLNNRNNPWGEKK